MNKPLVSVIIPTKNSEKFLGKCLESIKNQTYKNIEIIVVDNNSIDKTKEIAKKFTDKVFNKGPERSAQVNFGVENSNGEYVYKVDSDFILDKRVIEQCIDEVKKGYDAIVVHNSPDISVSWIARVRKFEVDMYKYDITHSSARFIKKVVYKKIGGFNEFITVGEDYDFQNKLNRGGFRTGFVDAEAIHLGEPTNFWKHMKKYYDYVKDFVNYEEENKSESKKQFRFFRNVYLKNWKKFIKHPILGNGFIIYNFFKFGFGGAGYFVGRVKKNMKNYLQKLYEKAVNFNHKNIFNLLEKNSNAKFLDLGCDDGVLTMKMANKIGNKSVYGVEIVDERIKLSKQNGIQVKKFDLNKKFDFENNYFDVVIANQVIEHIYNSDNFISEIYRILKPKGYAIISTENASSWCNIIASIMGWQIFSLMNFSSKKQGIGNPFALHRDDFSKLESWNHVRIYNIRGLKEYFEAFGFEVEKIKGAGYFPLPAIFVDFDKTHCHFITFKIKKIIK